MQSKSGAPPLSVSESTLIECSVFRTVAKGSSGSKGSSSTTPDCGGSSVPGHAARSKPGVPLPACEFEAPADPNWEQRSNEEWVRPFVPHGSADFNYSLATGEKGQWVAQYFPKDPSKYPLSTYMTQKTTLLGAKDPKDPAQRHCRSNTMTTSLLVFPLITLLS